MSTAPLLATLLDVPIRIRGDESLTTAMATSFSALLARPVSGHDVCELNLDASGQRSPSELSNQLVTDAPPLQVALAELTGFALANSPLLCVHAGVVAGPHGTIVIPGESGHGKTTLTAALVQAGAGYLSDEVLALDRSSAAVIPFPRPLALDGRSLKLLGLAEPVAASFGETLIDPARLGSLGIPAPVSDIVLSRRSDVAQSLQPSTRGQAVRELLKHSFNHYSDPQSSFELVVRVARSARVWFLDFHNAVDAATELTIALRDR